MFDWKTIERPQGQSRGFYYGWKIEWLAPDFPNGFVIQRMNTKFNLHDCDSREPLDEQEIWSSLGYNGNPRFNFYEVWQVKDGGLPGQLTDTWGLQPRQLVFPNDPDRKNFKDLSTSGTCLVEGWAAFYEGVDLMELGSGWGIKGENSGSPLSKDLLSTIEEIHLPENPNKVHRWLKTWWNGFKIPLDTTTNLDYSPKTK